MKINIKPDGSKTAAMFVTKDKRTFRKKEVKKKYLNFQEICKRIGIP